MSKASLKDLNLILFEQLERLNDPDDEGDLDKEIKRANAITKVSTAIINNASTILEAKRLADYLGKNPDYDLLEIGYGNDSNKVD